MEDDTTNVGFHVDHLSDPMMLHTNTYAACIDKDHDGLSRMASTALGQEFSPPAFEQFQANPSAGVLPHTAVPEPAGPSVAADKGKVPMPDLDIPAEFLAEDYFIAHPQSPGNSYEDETASELAKELDDLMMRMTETDWLNLMMQVGSNPALARELLGADTQPTQTNHTGQQYPNNVQSQQFQQFQTASISANNAKFPYLEKDKYEIWAMKDGGEKVKASFGGMKRSKKMREDMLKQQFTEFSVTEEEGLHKGYDRFQKILIQLNQVQARPDNDDINLKFLRALPSSCYGVKAASRSTHSAFIGAASSGSKLNYSNQQSIVPSVSQTSGRSDSIMECVFHSFVAENEPDQDMIYEDFDQVDQLEMEELDLKWQMAMLSLRINRFEKKAGRKGSNVKTVDDKARYSAFKVTEVKTDEPKALVSVDSMVNWSDHAAENKTGEVEKVYGMMAGLHADNGGADVSEAAAEFGMMGISPKAQKEKKEWEVKFEATLARFEKWKESSKNLKKLINSSMSTRTKIGPSIKEYIGKTKCSSLHHWNLYATPYQSDIEETQVSYGSKSDNKTSETLSESNDFVSCDNSDKSSDSETYASCDSSLKTKTKDFPPAVDIKTLPESDVEDPNSTAGILVFVVGEIKQTISRIRFRLIPAGWSKRPAPVSAGRPVSAGWLNPAARPYFRPSSVYFNNMYWPNLYDPMYMNKGRWGTAGDPSTDNDIELQHFNLFSVSQICDKKNKVLFTDTDCLVLKEDFQLPDESQVVLRIPRKCDLYTFSISELQPEQNVTCLVAKASLDESTRWHRRMAHVNFKTINKLAKEGLVDGLPLKVFTNEHNCVACNKGKQHKASYKHISAVRLITETLQLLHMDLFGPNQYKEYRTRKSSSNHGPMFWNAMRLCQKILLSSKTRIEAKDHCTICFVCSQETAEIISQAKAEIRNHGVSADRDPAGIDSAGGVSAGSTSAGSDPAGGNPAGSFQPTSSFKPAGKGNPAVSTSVSADFIPVHADESTLPPGQSLASSEHTTRFPVPSEYKKRALIMMRMDVKSAFLYGEIEEEVYVTQPKGFEDPFFPKHVYRVLKLCMDFIKHLEPGMQDCLLFCYNTITEEVYVDDIIFGSTNKAWCDEFEVLMKGEFEMSAMGEMTFFLGLQVKQLPDGIFISQDKYVKDMLTKFDMESVRTATTPYEAAKTKLKDETDPPVNVHLYRSMIGSLMYLTASRPDIMFAVSACSRHQVTPLTSHLNAVKKIFKYLKGQPKLGLWYPKDSPFQLEAYSDSDYAGSHGDRKSTTGGCQFLGRRLISWQCKKQTIVATSSTEAEYVAAASCCAQVLWIQNQLLDYGFNFMNTKIFIDNQSTICIVKNPVFHQRTKHIEIRHHFIRDANEKNLIQVLKIHTDDNVADLLTKAFDGPRFEYLVVHIGMVDMVFCGILFSCDCRVCVPAVCMVSAVGCLFLLAEYIHAAGVVYAAYTSIYVLNCFCCAQFDIAGWLVSATSHLVFAGSLQSCWCHNVSAA
ncbi:putative ribonuclease H-like domain-containing protein [Tanacetum coccineum]